MCNSFDLIRFKMKYFELLMVEKLKENIFDKFFVIFIYFCFFVFYFYL